MARKENRLVYSTDPEQRRQLKRSPGKAPDEDAHPGDQTAKISRATRRGKTVTVVSDLRHCPQAFKDLTKLLKQHCAAGGTYKDGEIEIQGDHRQKVAEVLRSQGYKVKFSGG